MPKMHVTSTLDTAGTVVGRRRSPEMLDDNELADYGTNGYLEFGTGTDGALPFRVDQSGNVTANGVNTAAGAAVISSPGFSSGSASQLSDTTRDYMVYFQIGTGGGTVALAIGPTSGVANAILTAAAGVSGELLAVRLPAGWYLKITVATSTIAHQIAISC